MPKVNKLGILLEPTRLAFESTAVLNPATWQDGEYVHLYYRAIDKEHRSSIGYALLKGPTTVVKRWKRPIVTRKFKYESSGVEDPRIIKFGDTYYLFYVAHDGKNAVVAYATSKDLQTFSKHGVITPQIAYHTAEEMFSESKLKDAYSFFASYYEEQAGEGVFLWEKDTFMFPKKINGKFALIHRVLPEMQLLYFDNFKQLKSKSLWEKHLRSLSKHVILENTHWFESRNIGGGCPPIETKDGWLIIFHSVEARNKGRVYHACAALLDKDDPLKVIGRLHEPLFSPDKAWERQGFVSNVVFPTGTARFGDTLYIYYGAADKIIATASVDINELLGDIRNPRKRHSYGKKKRSK